MTVIERRAAFGLFKRVRAALVRSAAESRSRFAALAGLVVYMSFEGAAGKPEFPPGSSDANAVSKIVERLSEFRPEIDPTWVEGDIPPVQAPPITMGSTSFGCRFHAAPFTNALPDTPFFISTGFEVGFGMLSIHRPAGAWQQVVEIVERKDREGTDDLIITVGGPDRDGYAFPSEELVADLALRFAAQPPIAQHLSSVRLHFWTTGRIVQLIPERAEIVEPFYRGGLVPSHSQFSLNELTLTYPDDNN